jgi:hypothetical protein
MATSVYSAGTPGNLIGAVTVPHGASVAAFLDLSACIEGQVTVEMTTGTAPTAGTTFNVRKAYAAGSSAPATLSASVTAGTASTSLSVSSSAGLHQGQQIVLQQAGGSKLGELVTISGAITGTGPYTVPITGTGTSSGTLNAYTSGDGVYLITQTAQFAVVPSSAAGAWAANTDYSAELLVGPGQWVVTAVNGDSTQSVTVNVTVDKVTAYQ